MKFSLLNLFIFSFSLAAQAEQVTIATKHSTMVLEVENGKQPQYVYFGQKLSDFDLTNLQAPRNGRMNAYPAYGMDCPAEAAIAVTHADGNMSTELFVTGMEKQDGILRIILKDPVYPTTVALCYKAYEDEDMIETWTEITNGEAKPVTLTQFASICLPIRRGNVWLSHFYGSWANEARLVEEPILPGEKVIKNKDGTRNSHTDHAEVMFSLDGKGRENAGSVIGAALCYSGNFQLKIDTDDTEPRQLRVSPEERRDLHHPEGRPQLLAVRTLRRLPQLPQVGPQIHARPRQQGAQDPAQLLGGCLLRHQPAGHGPDDGRHRLDGR